MGTIKPHVALLSSPGMGHLIPMLELGHRLASIFGLRVTVFSVTTDASTVQSQLDREFSAYKEILTVVLLRPADLSSLMDRSISPVSQSFIMMRHSLQSLRSSISSMEGTRPTTLVTDMFGIEAFAVANEFRMLKYVFFATNVWYLAVVSYLPYLDRIDEDDHVKRHNPLNLPGCESVRFEDTIGAFSSRHDQALFDCYKSIGTECAGCDGILVNTWEALEPKTLRALRDYKTMGQFLRGTHIYSIGPLVRPGRPMKQDLPRSSKVLEWLDMQPRESVLYVSFGSGGTLSTNQLAEMAWGLEQSGHRFVWVLRPPVKDSSSGSFFKLGDRTDQTPEYLPDGFVTRTQNTGLVVPMWAPQSDVLAHASVGGFLSHCGWNSTLECILNGLPIIAWPLYAEQKMNATMLAEQLGTAVKPRKLPSSEIVIGRDEIEEMVRRVMDKEGDEGKELRRNAQELKSSAEEAIREGGSSSSMLSQFARKCEHGPDISITSEVHESKDIDNTASLVDNDQYNNS